MHVAKAGVRDRVEPYVAWHVAFSIRLCTCAVGKHGLRGLRAPYQYTTKVGPVAEYRM